MQFPNPVKRLQTDMTFVSEFFMSCTIAVNVVVFEVATVVARCCVGKVSNNVDVVVADFVVADVVVADVVSDIVVSVVVVDVIADIFVIFAVDSVSVYRKWIYTTYIIKKEIVITNIANEYFKVLAYEILKAFRQKIELITKQ